MSVGDLVKPFSPFPNRAFRWGIVVELVVDDPINPERNTVRVHWNGGMVEKLNARLLEAVCK